MCQGHLDNANHHRGEADRLDGVYSSSSGSTKRKAKKERNYHRKQDKKYRKKYEKCIKKEQKYEHKEDKIEIRQENRTERNENKWEAQSIAYANGIDPRANALNAVGGIVSAVGTSSAQLFGGLSQYKGTRKDSSKVSPLAGIDLKSLVPWAIVALAFFFLKPSGSSKRKRR